jgi:sugar O-acyltransferase (sialic acid O-acetyltransferase NeuD family)
VSPDHLVVIGAGEHARVVLDAAESRPDRWTVDGTVDSPDRPARRVPVLPTLGDDAAFLARLMKIAAAERPAIVLGVGAPTEPDRRRAIVERYRGIAEWATVIHATATISPTATIEEGSVVLAAAIVGPGARIGPHVVVNSGAVVEHDVTLGAFSQVGPGAAIGGATTIGEGTLVGLGASVRDHLTIGSEAVVGMGAVVVADVAVGTLVVGTPARQKDAIGAVREP